MCWCSRARVLPPEEVTVRCERWSVMPFRPNGSILDAIDAMIDPSVDGSINYGS